MAERNGSCNSEAGEFTRKSDRLRSTICCKQQCCAFVRQIAQSLAMSAVLDFRKCKRLLLSSLAVSLATQGFTPQEARCNATCRSPYIKYRKTKRTSENACPFCWRRERDSNPCASFLTTAFRVRLVMTTSISLQSDYVGEMPNVCNIQHFAGFGNHIAAILQKSFNSDSRKK